MPGRAMTLVEKLRIKTNDAIAEGKRKAAEKEAQEKAAKLRKEAEWNRIAMNAIDKIPSVCEAAAENGLSQATVFRLVSNRDYATKGWNNTLVYTQLCGPAAIVWSWCREAGFDIKIQYGYSGDGWDSWFDFVVSWS